MAKSQMEMDIESWSRDRLQTWFDDTMMRYQVIGMKKSDAMSMAMTTLLFAAAGGVALQTQMPAIEAAREFGKLVLHLRLALEKENETED